MRTLTVLYDHKCRLCTQVRSWLVRQPQFVPLEFVAAGSDELRRRYPQLDPDESLLQLVVIGDHQKVYRGGKAWVMCLWALRDYRSWAMRLGSPELYPLAERYFRWLSRNRGKLGGLRFFFREFI